MAARERLPQHHADRPHVRRAGSGIAGKPLGRDVGERAGNIALRGQRLRLGHAREAEVEELRRNSVSFGEEDVRRLDVAMEDARAMGVSEPLRDLGARLDSAGIVEVARAQRLAERSSRNELVRDVDVAVVPGERIRAQAAGVAQLRCG